MQYHIFLQLNVNGELQMMYRIYIDEELKL